MPCEVIPSITRASTWEAGVNPWLQRDRLPQFEGGLLGELLHGNEPVVVQDLPARLSTTEPARKYLQGMGSLVFVPLFDRGVAINGVVLMRKAANAFDTQLLPQHVWMANLFGRATQNLVLSEELQKVYTKQQTPDQAAKSLQDRWDKITDDQGVDTQVAALQTYFKAFPTVTDTPSA